MKRTWIFLAAQAFTLLGLSVSAQAAEICDVGGGSLQSTKVVRRSSGLSLHSSWRTDTLPLVVQNLILNDTCLFDSRQIRSALGARFIGLAGMIADVESYQDATQINSGKDPYRLCFVFVRNASYEIYRRETKIVFESRTRSVDDLLKAMSAMESSGQCEFNWDKAKDVALHGPVWFRSEDRITGQFEAARARFKA